MPPIDIAKPLLLHLTASYLLSKDLLPFIAGLEWQLRFQIRTSADVAQSLTGAVVLFSVRHEPSSAVLLTRRSDTDIVGSNPLRKQILIDADQTTEDTSNNTGKGWFTLRFGRESADRVATLAAVGKHGYDICVIWGDLSNSPYARGQIEILGPYTNPVA